MGVFLPLHFFYMSSIAGFFFFLKWLFGAWKNAEWKERERASETILDK